MKRDALKIEEPCHESWEGMENRGARRFCDSCVKEVHDLSMLTEEETQALLSQDEQVCVRYAVDTRNDEILFRDEASPMWRMYRQREGIKTLLAAAMVAVPMMMAGCDTPAPTETTTAVSPIEIEGAGPRLAPGAARKPTMSKKNTTSIKPPKPVHEDVLMPLMGEPPMLEEPPVVQKPSKVHVQGAPRMVHTKGDAKMAPQKNVTPPTVQEEEIEVSLGNLVVEE